MVGLRLAQIYMDPETMSRYDRACKLLHWSESGLVRQAIAAYFKVHLDYYVECSYRDLEAREMAVEDWYTTLRDKSIEELPRYKRGRPAFGATPLDTISPVDTGFKNKRRYGTIALGGFNFVLLRVAQLVDLGPQTQLISRIVKYHFDQYWETNYLPQIEFDEQTTLPRRNHAGLDNRRR